MFFSGEGAISEYVEGGDVLYLYKLRIRSIVVDVCCFLDRQGRPN